MFFSRRKKIPRSQVACEELKREGMDRFYETLSREIRGSLMRPFAINFLVSIFLNKEENISGGPAVISYSMKIFTC